MVGWTVFLRKKYHGPISIAFCWSEIIFTDTDLIEEDLVKTGPGGVSSPGDAKTQRLILLFGWPGFMCVDECCVCFS